MRRRRFIRLASTALASLSFLPYSVGKLHAQSLPQAVWVENGEPEALLRRALKEYGGLERFIQKGNRVVIKPNIGWDRPPELAANTNPHLVAALVKACKQAGAREVIVFDRTCNNPRRCYRNSQIEKLAKDAGARVEQIRPNRFKNIAIQGQLVKEWPIYETYLKADKVINVPIAKHHSLSRVTLGLKNLMGVMGGNRGDIHNHFAQKLAEIDRKILPTLTIIDAYRILTDNGPIGGNPKDVKLTKTLIISDCTVSADYLALQLFDLKLDEVAHVQVAYQMGLAKYAPEKLKVKRIQLS
ncbi:protein of unknown function DUF362 [Caldithrix abyssi DSM 13497]|uniref:Uncharacterized conserved protein, DUF362 family n=1 Tax=Caldithrix abyssi DSM 13497 TaxID=880073 RepID=H1XUN6_CALAY|nr:DUF362 domain-containing protein [Caldithrix abyssi]APF16807.1 Uncharacterized conserved protein, DUF362 family [Caldithrix abyssi DSM 13497]EHO40535.1 protein of unknown function DUF362 [Caldithrix abyssi DSM 13497]